MDKLFLPYKAHSTPAVYSIKKNTIEKNSLWRENEGGDLPGRFGLRSTVN